MTRARAADVVLLLAQEADRTGDERYRVTPTTLRSWVYRGHITRDPKTDGYDLHEILTYLESRDTPVIKPISITQNPDGTTTLLVEGHDISHSATGLQLDIRAGDLARVTIDLGSAALAYTGEADVTVNPTDAEALVALGWTPPAEAASPAV
ncbi:hypothetical protein VSH64_24925 [Amycolatopsis rhabdoformis]|uniref:MerR family transcriptional regulator n=1 Tax=Amycolatopsis rhabdoformis TaxID=1448059 RepID=A0ABZ1HUT6_9PSEU|nr:hypothetical protein [Amycolatopsis rhabdoformis]WSE26122.1 hypothetical protein VSH64_24925 [Amycolatopsis rhabdoformis]